MYANEIKKCQYNKAKLINFTLIKNQSYFFVVCSIKSALFISSKSVWEGGLGAWHFVMSGLRF